MGKFDSLIADINIDRENLSHLVNELNELREKLKEVPDSTQIRAAGSILHDFYTGLEKILERIALIVDGGMPEGEDWHIQLLRRMFAEVPQRRPPVFSDDLNDPLNEYLRFRHLFRNIYGFELKWERFQNLVEGLSPLFSKLNSQLENFEKFLKEI